MIIGFAGRSSRSPAGNVGVVDRLRPGPARDARPGPAHRRADPPARDQRRHARPAAPVPGDRRRLEGAPDGQADRHDELPHRWPFASDLFQRVGTDFAEKIIDPAFNDFIKTVVPEYSVNDILAKRDEIRSLAKEQLGRTSPSTTSSWTTSTSRTSPSRTASSRRSRTSRSPSSRSRRSSRSSPSGRSRRSRPSRQARAQADATVALAKGQAEANELLAALADRPDPAVPVHPEAHRQDHGDAAAGGQPGDLRPQEPARPEPGRPTRNRRPRQARQ